MTTPWISRVQRYWAGLAKASAWIIGVVATFVASPPALAVARLETSDERRFVQFVFAVAIGLFFVRTEGVPRRRWWWISITLLLGGAAAYNAYQIACDLWSCAYNQRDWVIGSPAALSTDAKAFIASQPYPQTCDALLSRAHGEAQRVWDSGSMIAHYEVLSGLYTMAMLLLAGSAMSIVEFIRPRGDRDGEVA